MDKPKFENIFTVAALSLQERAQRILAYAEKFKDTFKHTLNLIDPKKTNPEVYTKGMSRIVQKIFEYQQAKNSLRLFDILRTSYEFENEDDLIDFVEACFHGKHNLTFAKF